MFKFSKKITNDKVELTKKSTIIKSQNSIEEKIYELQEKKAKLADNMLDTKTTFVNKLTRDEIMKLFE